MLNLNGWTQVVVGALMLVGVLWLLSLMFNVIVGHPFAVIALLVLGSAGAFYYLGQTAARSQSPPRGR